MASPSLGASPNFYTTGSKRALCSRPIITNSPNSPRNAPASAISTSLCANGTIRSFSCAKSCPAARTKATEFRSRASLGCRKRFSIEPRRFSRTWKGPTAQSKLRLWQNRAERKSPAQLLQNRNWIYSETPPSLGDGSKIAAFHEPGNPDAALVEQTHRQRHRDQCQNVRRRRDDGRQDKDQDDGIGPGACHESVGDQSKSNQRQNDHGQFERQAEPYGESCHERIILLHGPRGRPAERLGVTEEKENRLWQ